jgi:hypothetical protein
MRFVQEMKYKSYLGCFLFAAVRIFFSNVIVLANFNPAEDWHLTTPEEQGMRSQNLADMMEVIRKNRYSIDVVNPVQNPEKFAPIVESLEFE